MGKKRKAQSEIDTDTCRRLYCVCRQPNDENKMMMCCDFCHEWFHPACVGVDEDEAEAVARWHCPGCIDLMSVNPVMSKKRYPNFYIIHSMEQFLSLLKAESRGAAGGGGGKLV